MSSFTELQAEKQNWKLASDDKLFAKLKNMQENMVGSAHLIHASMGELNRAINAAHTTLYNSINAFNALTFNKFLENAVDDTPDLNGEEEEENLLGDLRGEDEKMATALNLALTEIQKSKEKGEGEEEAASQAETEQREKQKAKGSLGVSNLFKLPYVIGTKEYDKHPFAGLVFVALDDSLEQVDLYQ